MAGPYVAPLLAAVEAINDGTEVALKVLCELMQVLQQQNARLLVLEAKAESEGEQHGA